MRDPKYEAAHLARALPRVLPEFLQQQRWFSGKGRNIVSTHLADIVPLANDEQGGAFLLIVRVEYADGGAETYALPLEPASDERSAHARAPQPLMPVLRLPGNTGHELAFRDAFCDPEFSRFLLEAIPRHARFPGRAGEIEAIAGVAFERLAGPIDSGRRLDPGVLSREQSNTSIRFGDRLIMKFFRRLEEDINPDAELGTFLSERCAFAHVPPLAGNIFYRRRGGSPASLALVQAFIPNQGDAWQYTLAALSKFFDVIADSRQAPPSVPQGSLLALAQSPLPAAVEPAIGPYLDAARLLGQRTAELHAALASDADDPGFAPERFSRPYQQTLHQAMLAQAEKAFGLLACLLPRLPPASRELAARVGQLEPQVRARLGMLLSRPLNAARIRIHGDYHLAQVLRANEDFVIVDFEGEPARPIRERRRKASPLKDVAGMLRSFHYATQTAVLSRAAQAAPPSPAPEVLRGWARYWNARVSAVFLNCYLASATPAHLLPPHPADLETLLQAYQLEKALYELEYEINNRPDWVQIPLEGIQQMVARND